MVGENMLVMSSYQLLAGTEVGREGVKEERGIGMMPGRVFGS